MPQPSTTHSALRNPKPKRRFRNMPLPPPDMPGFGCVVDIIVEPPDEKVNHPKHYGGDTTYEAIKVIEAWELGFCLGNTAKYICRAGKKATSAELDDLKKAAWYLNRRIEQVEKHISGQAAIDKAFTK